MKAIKLQTPVMNPVYRDLTLVLIASLLVSVVFVTAGYFILVQIVKD